MVNEEMKKAQKILKNFEELSTFWIDLELDDFCSLFENINETCLYAFEFEDQEGGYISRFDSKIFFQNPKVFG